MIPLSTATAVQAALPVTATPLAPAMVTAPPTLTATLQVARPPTANPTVLATVGATASPAPPQEVPALLDGTPPLTMTIEMAPADPAVRTLPDDVLLIETRDRPPAAPDLTDRQLLLVDVVGKQVGAPTADQERLEWCSPFRDSYSPSGFWSASGRYLVAGCQGLNGYWTSAVLDLDAGVWLRVTPPARPLVHDPSWNTDRPSGIDEVGLGPWLIPDEQLIVRLYQDEYVHGGAQTQTRETLWIWSLTDSTIRRIADFDGPQGFSSMRVTLAEDQRQLAIQAQRADDPHPRVYLWNGGSTLQRLSVEMPLPVSALRPSFQSLLVSAGDPAPQYALAPNGRQIAIHEATGWQIYTDDGRAHGRLPDRPVVLGTRANWSVDSSRVWVCQSERDVGAHLTELDQDGGIIGQKTYPNVVFANAPCVAESASGYRAISLSNPLVIILDSDLREQGTVEGTALGWRPHPE